MRPLLLSALLLAFASLAPASSHPLKLLRPGDKVLFLGDSITNNGFYIAAVDTFLRLHAPDANLELINLGLGSETASGLSENDHPFPRPSIHQRLSAVLDFVKPDAVFFCYGMNDGIYHPFSEERFQAYQDGVNRLVSACRQAGARVIALTPPPFDPLSKDPASLLPAGQADYSYKVSFRDYDEVLHRYGAWLRTGCQGLSATIDVHSPVASLNAACRQLNPAYRSGDGIHPLPAGHLAMAGEILSALGFDPAQARSTLQAESGASLDPAVLASSTSNAPASSDVFRLVQQRLQLLLSSYREHTGHGHPNKTQNPLPPAEAAVQASQLNARILAAIEQRSSLSSIMRDTVRHHISLGALAGAVTLVARNGRIEDLQAHGFADREAARPMNPETIFRIHSFTKALTSAAALQLLEQGKFLLDDPISKWLPEFASVKVDDQPAKHPILVRHLFTHSSGISYVNRAAFEEPNLAAMSKKLAQVPLAHEPGYGWTYGASIDVLGRLIEVWSGQPYEAFLHKSLLHPLGMANTAFHVPPAKRHRLATLYQADPKDPKILTPSQAAGASGKPVPSGPPSLCQPGGGLYSTAQDYYRFLQMIQNNGELEGRRHLKAETVKLMQTNQLSPAAGWVRFGQETRDGFGYGLGFNVVTQPSQWDPDARPGESGWGGAASCHYWMHPQDKLIVITLEQTLPYRRTLERALKAPLYQLLQSH